jgi:hypothetical protein
MRALVLCIAVLALAAGACTMLTNFDPEGQPCDINAPVNQQCLERFHCENGKCVKGDPPDAG